MVLVEKSFPRGGTTPTEEKPQSGKDNIIFGAQKIKLKKVKTKPINDLSSELEDHAKEEEETIKSVSAELLGYDTIQDGMNIMGIVKAVDQLYLSISLPGRMIARVSALEISDSYTKATREYLQDTASTKGFKPLTKLYNVGQLVYGRVQEVRKNERGRTDITMSLRPAEVHAELVHLNVRKGFIFSGAVEEVQEHGYIIESGIKGLRTFVPLEKGQQGRVIGELVYLKVEKITTDQAASTCICKEVRAESLKVKSQKEPNIDYILPTSIVQFHVTKRLKDGLQGTVMNEAFTAYINEHQLAEPLALPEDYEPNTTLNARVLYVMPLTKFVYLTLNLRNGKSDVPAADTGDGDAGSLTELKRGDIIEKAKVHHLGTGGVILVLHNRFKGIISYRTIKSNYKGNYDQDELLARYAKLTKHKVRVLNYDPMDSLYVCTDDATIVNEPIFALDDLQPGAFVTAVVRQRDPKIDGYALQVGKVRGSIERFFLAPTTAAKALEDKTKLRCRVIAVSSERRLAYLTNRPEYMDRNARVLTSLADARPNTIFIGTVVKCDDTYVLVRFFNQLQGVLHRHQLRNGDAVSSFYVGQTMPFRVVLRNGEQIGLGLADDTFALGEIVPVTVVNALDSGLEVKVAFGEDADAEKATANEVRGHIPLRLLSDHVDLVQAKLRMFGSPSVNTEAVCLLKNVFSLRDVAYFRGNLTKNWQSVQVGDVLKACVKNVSEDVVELMLPLRDYSRLVRVHRKMLLVGGYRQTTIMLAPEQVVYVKVLGKEKATKTVTVSAKLTDVWDGQLDSTADRLKSYLKEVSEIQRAYKKLDAPIAKHRIGRRVSASFKRVDAATKDWVYEVDGVATIVRSSIAGKARPPAVDVQQECIVIWIDYSQQVLYVSNRPSDLAHITGAHHLPANLAGGNKSGINAKVMLKQENLFICSLKKGPNPLIYCPTQLHFNDFEHSAGADVVEGEFCKLAFIHASRPLAVLDSTWKLWKDIKRKRHAQEEAEAEKRKKAKLSWESQAATTKSSKVAAQAVSKLNKAIEDNVTVATDDEAMEIDEAEAGTKPRPKMEKFEKTSRHEKKPKQKQVEKCIFFEDTTPDNSLKAALHVTASKEQKLAPAKTLPGITDYWNTSNTLQSKADMLASSDEEHDDDDAKDVETKKRKITVVEKFRKQREEEDRLRTIEERYADPKQLPETVDQFDRLVLSEPNNSRHWINYMVFHLQATEIEKARAVARRAIRSISFRDVAEQLNVWVALLNLELRYGTRDDFDATLREAITNNDPLKVQLRCVELLSEATDKQSQLMEMITVLTKKFRGEPELWRTAANAYFGIGQVERAQQMLHKALASLPEREHVNTIVMFANLNHKHAQKEMAQTLLDQVVTSYPKRVDVWTQYVDMLVKDELIESARNVLERAVMQKIPLKKMRTIFKKYLEFEERFGSDDDVQKVKNLAIKYVQNNANL